MDACLTAVMVEDEKLLKAADERTSVADRGTRRPGAMKRVGSHFTHPPSVSSSNILSFKNHKQSRKTLVPPPKKINFMEQITKAGVLRKKGTRMYQWAPRYFILGNASLKYKIKQEDTELKGQFDLRPGCIVTDIEEDTMGFQGKRLYSFWVVWPQDRHRHPDKTDTPSSMDPGGYDSSDENELSHSHGITQVNSSDKFSPGPPTPAKTAKSLKNIVTHEAKAHKEAKEKVEEQINLHVSHDKHMVLGMKVAAAVAGGVIIGASTAGVGLIPYMVIVGTAAAAGAAGVVGGAAWTGGSKRPFDSRVILATETKDDAKEWKAAIEHQIALVERKKKPQLPSDINPVMIMTILEMGKYGECGGWQKVKSVEGVRILERKLPPPGCRCRRAQVVVKGSPVETFLTLMETPCPFWPTSVATDGELKVLKVIDDHADIIRLTFNTKNTMGYFGPKNDGFQIEVILHRFWKYDDDGVYMITYSSTGQTQFSSTGSTCVPRTSSQLDMHVVFTISPRKDHNEFDDDLPEALVTCTCLLSEKGWAKQEYETFVNGVLQPVIDLRNYFLRNAFVRFLPGQARDPKFNSTVAYLSEGVQRSSRGQQHAAPMFTKKEQQLAGVNAPSQSKIKRSVSEGPQSSLFSNESLSNAPASAASKGQVLRSATGDAALSLSMDNPGSLTPRPPLFARMRSDKVLPAQQKPEPLQIDTYSLEKSLVPPADDERKRKKYSADVKGKIASLEYEVKREEKRLSSALKTKTTPNIGDPRMNLSMENDNENLVEKKQQLVKLKDAYRQVTGKEYDKATKGRLRGLRKFTARALRRRAYSQEVLKMESSASTPKTELPSVYKSFSLLDKYPGDVQIDPKDFKYVPRRVPLRWENNSQCYCDFLAPHCKTSIACILGVVLSFLCCSVLEEQLRFIF